MLALEDAAPFFGLDVFGFALVARLRRAAVAAPIDAEVVVPVVIAARRLLAVERVRRAVQRRRRLGAAAAFA